MQPQDDRETDSRRGGSGAPSVDDEGALVDPLPDGEPDGGSEVEQAGVSPRFATVYDRHRQRHKGLLPESWRVRVPVFEGPLDLLLHLIRINEVEITDIPVALICDQYHEYLDLMEELDLDVAGEYIYEAAVLIQLKSRLLLPQPKVEPGEPEPEDPRQELVQRLLEYRRIREVAESLAEVSSVRSGLWTRARQPLDLGFDEAEVGEIDIGNVSLFDLLKVFRGVLERYEREHPAPLSLRGESFSVRDQIERLLGLLDRARPLDLVDDLLALSCRAEAIAAFLAVLEMGKLQLIDLTILPGGGIGLVRTEREVTALELEAVSS